MNWKSRIPKDKYKTMSKTKNKNSITLEEFKEKNYGKRGRKGRDELEAGY
jgi:hypothetical protein